jgi:anaphase-promoting complex subunit 10
MQNLREIGDNAVWTLSSAKTGNGVEQLRDGSQETFWQ